MLRLTLILALLIATIGCSTRGVGEATRNGCEMPLETVTYDQFGSWTGPLDHLIIRRYRDRTVAEWREAEHDDVVLDATLNQGEWQELKRTLDGAGFSKLSQRRFEESRTFDGVEYKIAQAEAGRVRELVINNPNRGRDDFDEIISPDDRAYHTIICGFENLLATAHFVVRPDPRRDAAVSRVVWGSAVSKVEEVRLVGSEILVRTTQRGTTSDSWRRLVRTTTGSTLLELPEEAWPPVPQTSPRISPDDGLKPDEAIRTAYKNGFIRADRDGTWFCHEGAKERLLTERAAFPLVAGKQRYLVAMFERVLKVYDLQAAKFVALDPSVQAFQLVLALDDDRVLLEQPFVRPGTNEVSRSYRVLNLTTLKLSPEKPTDSAPWTQGIMSTQTLQYAGPTSVWIATPSEEWRRSEKYTSIARYDLQGMRQLKGMVVNGAHFDSKSMVVDVEGNRVIAVEDGFLYEHKLPADIWADWH